MDIKTAIYTKPRQADELKQMLTCLQKNSHILEYSLIRNQIYTEYFDTRKYFLDIYLDAISNAYVAQVGMNEFLAAFIGKYIDIIAKE